jgi:Na+/H+ antiporter NhaD/arsenite permease-like protein
MRLLRLIGWALASLPVAGGIACAGDESGMTAVNPWMITPFVVLLLTIAVAPLIRRTWWERYYPHVSISLGTVTAVYYLFVLQNPLRMLRSAEEYVSFIVLIGSLYVVAGGIHIRIKGKSKPTANVFLLAIGAVISNVVGTTGASMILIRPYLRVNRYRIKPYHVVFFIFVVSNIGGALTPIGDPPLFLGYLRGIPFFWVAEHLWYKWAIGMVAVIAIFYAIDLIHFRRLPASVRHGAEGAEEEGEAAGTQNVFFLTIILVAVFITNPPFLREALMVVAAYGSYRTTQKEIYRKNEFNFLALMEVALIFLGIFATMVPALDWMEHNAASIGIRTPGQFFWATGTFSSVLDNAPTYLNFLTAAIGLFVNDEIVRQVYHLVQTQGADIAALTGQYAEEVRNTFGTLTKYHADMVAAGSVPLYDIQVSYLIGNHSIYIQAVSIAAVFFGACTYIGNGPNFMVKSIAEQSGVKCPTFFGYVFKYTFPVLMPIFVIIWLLYFTGWG